MVTSQVEQFFQAIHRNPSLTTQLYRVDRPDRLVEVAAENGYSITLEELQAVLIQYKSDSKCVRIDNLTGDSFWVANWGRLPMGNWLGLFEELGIVRPFCNLDQRGKQDRRSIFSRTMTDVKSRTYELSQCFLPRGYFVH